MAATTIEALSRQSGVAGTAVQRKSFTRAVGRWRCQPVRAEKRGLDFSNRGAADTGYLKEDSAGQENIFAVESKSFVAGSSKDVGTNSGANAAFAGLAFAVAALAIGGGSILAKDKAPVAAVPTRESAAPEALSSISKRLASSLPAAPAVSE